MPVMFDMPRNFQKDSRHEKYCSPQPPSRGTNLPRSRLIGLLSLRLLPSSGIGKIWLRQGMPLSQGWINEASPANAITSLGKSLASVRLVGEGTEEMDVPGPERRLAAVLAADMVGYSRLMEGGSSEVRAEILSGALPRHPALQARS
jgi:hypothetical protein